MIQRDSDERVEEQPGDPREGEVRDAQSKERPGILTGALEELEDVDRAVRDALGKGKGVANSVGESVRDSFRSVQKSRNSVVMVRVNEESLGRLNDLVSCGLKKSRSEAAAFLIDEGIRAMAGLFEEITEQAQVIRNAREKLSRLLDEEPGETPA